MQRTEILVKDSMGLGEHYSAEQEVFSMFMTSGRRYTGEHDLEEEKK
jgi:hypothetical protein